MSGKKSSGRNPSALEKKIHKAALAAKRPLTQKEIDVLAPDSAKRTDALNYLAAAGLMKAQQASGGTLLWRAVTQEEFNIKQDLNTEEDMVLTQIQNAGNQGIWTKHLKTKTDLHQTVIDRCLKSLTSKQLIKVVKNVKYPTRKIYMLSSIDPSVELTGGPWYTDSEFDSEFIKNLCAACLRYIRDCTFPRQKADLPSSAQPLYAPSSSPDYPSTKQIQAWITRSKITPTKLSEEHVEELLNVLVLDGDIERLPAYGAAMFAANNDRDDSDSEPESDQDARKSKKRKKGSSSSEPKKRPRTVDSSDSASDSEGERRRKKSKKRRRSRSDDEDDKPRKRKKRQDESEDEDASDSEDERKRKRSKSKSSRRTSLTSSAVAASESDSNDSETTSDDDRHSRKRSRSKLSAGSSRKRKDKGRERSSSPAYDPFGTDAGAGGAYVYRAIRQERVALGWAQAPYGPVNPPGCEYYSDWLAKAVAALE
ncbi:RNA polymerase Rpc34 subunit-domain-containing protein [Vararia minispora EC-137]|uniref:RNA polymerase Rpc34 subunit-domain-containing protein n=1 Tax=Vararia minispora EC-137 TaxID=1314806 RepID=A0ACB8QZN9_9AGAM|nr:RNA polymerase Rpc34 subunit-domain-containing protein [Vararia minispora EC-137]